MEPLNAALRSACKLSGAHWAAWIQHQPEGWKLQSSVRLKPAHRASLAEYLQKTTTVHWLGGSLSNGRSRQRQTKNLAGRLNCQVLSLFPNQESHAALLVGSDGLDKTSQDVFQILTTLLTAPSRSPGSGAAGSGAASSGAAGSGAAGSGAASSGAKRQSPGKALDGPGQRAELLAEELVPTGVILDSSNPFLSQAAYPPEVVLKNSLNFLVQSIPAQAAYLAIRSGNFFLVKATWNERTSAHTNTGNEASTAHGASATPATLDVPIASAIVLQECPSVEQIVHTQQGLVIQIPEERLHTPSELKGLPKVLDSPTRSWMGIPILLGQRLIGLVGFASSKQQTFNQSHLMELNLRMQQVAYPIENAIVLDEAGRYLQQLALLNELASTASRATDLDEVARRVMRRLRVVFKADWAAVFLLSHDGKHLEAYGGRSQAARPFTDAFAAERQPNGNHHETWSEGFSRSEVFSHKVPVQGSLAGEAVAKGKPIYGRPLQPAISNLPGGSDDAEGPFRSELAVPLKYQGRVIGAIVLVSQGLNAFQMKDEQLLVLIASHMAGLFENMRLKGETQQRALKLQDTVRQLEAVRQTALDITADLDLNTLLGRIVQRAKDLVGARGVELGLLDEKAGWVRVVVSDTPWENFQNLEIPLMAGVSGKVAVLGEPILVADYNSWPGRLLPERVAPFQAVAGVPLKYGPQVIGTLTVMDDRSGRSFSDEDVRLLELLAPQAAISIRNAQLYQELQEHIQAQHEAENRLILSARLAAVGEMAAGVAHELNNPLTTVTGFTELVLSELPVDFAQRPDLELILQESLRARGVVRQLLDFARGPALAGQGAERPGQQRVQSDLNELVKQALTLVHHMIRTYGITLKVELSEGLPWILVDANQIKQVLLNLVHNAIYAMTTGGSVVGPHATGTLTTRTGRTQKRKSTGANLKTSQPAAEVDWLTVSVIDTGEGISPENMGRIFEPFFTTRAAKNTAEPGQGAVPNAVSHRETITHPDYTGTGLGLSVSYGIVASHDGFIEVESQLGKGSTFTVFLPLQSE